MKKIISSALLITMVLIVVMAFPFISFVLSVEFNKTPSVPIHIHENYGKPIASFFSRNNLYKELWEQYLFDVCSREESCTIENDL